MIGVISWFDQVALCWMINANVCLGLNAGSNYGMLAQHVMDEHITARLVGVPHLFPRRPWRVHTWRKTWPRCFGSASEDKPGLSRSISSQQATWLRSVEQTEYDNESRALQLSYTASVKHMRCKLPPLLMLYEALALAWGNGWVQRPTESTYRE